MNYYRPGFFILGTTDILGRIILCCGGLFCALQDIQQHPSVYLLDASSNHPPTRSANLQTLPNVFWKTTLALLHWQALLQTMSKKKNWLPIYNQNNLLIRQSWIYCLGRPEEPQLSKLWLSFRGKLMLEFIGNWKFDLWWGFQCRDLIRNMIQHSKKSEKSKYCEYCEYFDLRDWKNLGVQTVVWKVDRSFGKFL